MSTTEPRTAATVADRISPMAMWRDGLQPARKSSMNLRWAIHRIPVYLLAFVSGAAAMFGVDRTLVTRIPLMPAASMPAVSLPASPAIFESAATNRSADEIPVSEPDDLQASKVSAEEAVADAPTNLLRVTGMTEPASGRYAKLPLATSQAVAFVDVKPGDRVKKGYQVFSHWESPERLQAVKTEMERTKKLFDVAKVRTSAALQTVERLKNLKTNVAAQELQDAETMATIRQGELDAAELAVAQAESHFTAMEFEFTQAFVTSPIDGIVASVDVVAGERRQLSGPFRGVTVLDTSVLYCRCLLNQEQLATLQRLGKSDDRTDAPAADHEDQVGQRVQVDVESNGKEQDATVIWIGVQADAATGLIPVLLEVKNATECLRCGIQVNICFRSK